MSKLILIRHGQSQWNLQNRFTGWVDAPLTDKGVEEAREAGRRLHSDGYTFDFVFTSYLQRAIRTMWIVLQETGCHWSPVEKDWRLNERHYGNLQGLNKKETAEKYGEDQVFQWRRSYATPPPEAEGPLQEEQMADRRYRDIPRDKFPRGEALKQTVERVEPYWHSRMLPKAKSGQDLLVVAHGNSLRAMVKFLSGMNEQEITKFEFPTGVPLVCGLSDDCLIQDMTFLD